MSRNSDLEEDVNVYFNIQFSVNLHVDFLKNKNNGQHFYLNTNSTIKVVKFYCRRLSFSFPNGNISHQSQICHILSIPTVFQNRS